MRCGRCQRPLTASWSKGKTGKRYGYYHCYHCRKVKVKRESLEEAFTELLNNLQVKPGKLRAWRATLKDVWDNQGKEVRDAYHAKRKRVEELTRQKERLLDLLVDGTITSEDYETRLKKISYDLLEAEMLEKDAKVDKLDIEAALDYACHFLRNPAKF